MEVVEAGPATIVTPILVVTVLVVVVVRVLVVVVFDTLGIVAMTSIVTLEIWSTEE
jgi:hypothetical protein